MNTMPVPVKDLELTATQPIEMLNAQQHLIVWCDLKIASLVSQAAELHEATEHAKLMKWKSSTLERQHDRCVRRISYYSKVKAALLAGYYIIPNFPITLFAIRTHKKNPTGQSTSYWARVEQGAKELPINEGEYRNPNPLVEDRNWKDGDRSGVVRTAKEWDDIEFPITMAKPEIMKATSKAMELRIFDRVGIMPASKNDDPVIIGQIFHKSGGREKVVSFMIAWHLNTNVL